MSSPHYFLQLLELQQVEWLRLPLIQGIATSAVAGSEGLIRASRSALVQYINACEEQQRQVVVTTLLNSLIIILSENMQDDRYAIPVMELTAFLIDGYISTISAGLEPRSVLSFFLATVCSKTITESTLPILASGRSLFLPRRHISNHRI